MTNKAIIKDHFSKTATVWRDKIYKPKKRQGIFGYYDKQYRFDYVVDMIPPARNGTQRALDVGCGAGQLIPVLVERGYQAYAVDVSSQMIDYAKQTCQQSNIKADIRLGDCENFNCLDNFFDLYVAMGVIEYMDEDTLMLKEIMRVLCPGGTAIVTLRNIRSIHVRWRTVYRALFQNKIKDRVKWILGKKITPYRSISREHDPRRFRKQLDSLSFRFLEERYTHFHALPAPLDRLFSGVEAVLGKLMERYFCKGRFTFMASSYIVKFQKMSS